MLATCQCLGARIKHFFSIKMPLVNMVHTQSDEKLLNGFRCSVSAGERCYEQSPKQGDVDLWTMMSAVADL